MSEQQALVFNIQTVPGAPLPEYDEAHLKVIAKNSDLATQEARRRLDIYFDGDIYRLYSIAQLYTADDGLEESRLLWHVEFRAVLIHD